MTAKTRAIQLAAWSTVGVSLVVFGLALLYGARDVIVLFAVALLLAYMLLPVVHWVETVLPPRGSRNVALAVIYIALILILVSVARIIAGRVVEEGVSLISRLPGLLGNPAWIDRLPLPAWLGMLRSTITDA